MRANISSMNGSASNLPRGKRRGQRLVFSAEAARQSPAKGTGRAWINGREVGGTQGRFAHLGIGHD